MFYLVARTACRLVLLIIRRWEVNGKENIPSCGGMVVVSNHCSFWDPVIIGGSFDRKVSYMAKEELYKKNYLFVLLIKLLGAFPVRRGQTDRGAIKFALNYLETGNVIGLFPEGTRSKSGDLQEARNGAAMLAVKTGVPLIPVGIIGAKGWGKVTVNIGKPIETDQFADQKVNKELLQKVSTIFMEEIGKLTDKNQ